MNQLKQAVSLKGIKEGYQLIIPASASLRSVLEELTELKTQLKKDAHANHQIRFFVKTGDRRLNEEEQKQIIQIVEDDYFKIDSFESNVVSIEKALEWHNQSSPTLEVRNVRSGQLLQTEGDLLLIGDVHPGGTVRATGSIFIIGQFKGIAHAGFAGKENAVVVANFRYNAQVRVGDNVHIIEQKESDEGHTDESEFVYVNDLHIIEISPLEQLKVIRPEIGKYAGGLT